MAALLAPVALGAGTLLARTSAGAAPRPPTSSTNAPDAATVLTDAEGEPMALLYRRYRLPVGAAGIADAMKAAIVAIEDRRFYAHDGVDARGLARAVASNAVRGTPLQGQGASTIGMQYAKNQRLYTLADTPEERRAATADTLGGKVTEVRLAHRVEDRLDKDANHGRGARPPRWGLHRLDGAGPAGHHRGPRGRTGRGRRGQRGRGGGRCGGPRDRSTTGARPGREPGPGDDAAAGETMLPITTAPLRGAGSVNKIFTVVAALEQGLVTPASEPPRTRLATPAGSAR